MSTELEELVGFTANANPQVRLLAIENLVPYSTSEPSVFKSDGLKHVKNLKLLVKDHPKIAGHVITILINLSADGEVLENMATDENFLDTIFSFITSPKEPNANLLSMLLANLAKWDGLTSILSKKQSAHQDLGSDELVVNQLMDLFVKGAEGAYNKHADFDYLSYIFADLSKHEEVRRYLVTSQAYDHIVPLNKLKVFTEHKSHVRRKGVASTIKNVAFDLPSHPLFLSDDDLNMMPYLLLPITGNEEYDEEDMMAMHPDLQLLPPDKQRDPDPNIVQTHIETLLLLSTSREGREYMRRIRVYPIIRETHLKVNDEGVREACERLVQVLVRDEEPVGQAGAADVAQSNDDDDDKIVEI